MSILAKKTGGGGTDLGPQAPVGVHQAVCVDVVNLGMQTSTFEGKTRERPMVQIIWQLAKRDPQTKKRYLVGKRYTLSLNEKASLRIDLESWRSRPFTREEELGGFDVEKVIGANCVLNVQQVTKSTGTYSNVIAIMPKFENMQKLSPEAYQRAGTHEPEPEIDDVEDTPVDAMPVGQAAPPADITDDDIPF